MNISLCMIVKNEEDSLKRCLESVKNYVAEIIIVDTGSTDKTKDIAQKFTDKIYNFKWCNDFSKARNYSLEKASNNWVLVLDADEIVTNLDLTNIINILAANDQIVGRIKRINVIEDDLGTKRYIERVNRVFNKSFFKYDGMIHEQVVRIDGDSYLTRDINIIADHIGYTKEVISKSNKIQRNLSLLLENIKINAQDPYLYYQLGKTYFLDKKYEAAFQSFSKALTFEIDSDLEYAEDLIESYGYSMLNTKRYTDAMVLTAYEELYPSSLDFRFLIALIYMNNADFQNSIIKFSQCIGEKEGKIEGLNSYLSFYNIGIIYECLGLLDEALKYYKMCGNYSNALHRISSLK